MDKQQCNIGERMDKRQCNIVESIEVVMEVRDVLNSILLLLGKSCDETPYKGEA